MLYINEFPVGLYFESPRIGAMQKAKKVNTKIYIKFGKLCVLEYYVVRHVAPQNIAYPEQHIRFVAVFCGSILRICIIVLKLITLKVCHKHSFN